jgi:hypothetical protein
MAYGNVNVDTVTTSTAGGVLGAGNASIMKNRCINGDMRIDQRNGGASVSNGTGSFTYCLDRWSSYGSQASKFTVQQVSTAPAGFVNSLKVTSSSAYTVGASEYFGIKQIIEGYNIADLGWGTSSGKTVTLSFQVYTSLTGTFGGTIWNGANNQFYPFSYTVSSANTWATISVTIPAPTVGSTWATDNTQGIQVFFSLGAGSTVSGTANTWSSSLYLAPTGATSVVGTNGATFYITGVQLEVGSSATGYEYENYTQTLQKCQRYCYVPSTTNYYIGLANGSNQGLPWVIFPTTMRGTPTATFTGSFGLDNGSSSGTTSTVSLNAATTDGARTYFTSVSGASWTAGQAININGYNARAMIFSAEL